MPRCVLDIETNDDLYTVIRKCNTNFRMLIAQLSVSAIGDGGGGDYPSPATDYTSLENKPSIEGTTLVGDKLLPEINVHDVTEQFIDALVYGQGPMPPAPVIVSMDDYALLRNLPRIEGTELLGNRSLNEINVKTITEQDIDEIIYG